jgi:hypothetical protein
MNRRIDRLTHSCSGFLQKVRNALKYAQNRILQPFWVVLRCRTLQLFGLLLAGMRRVKVTSNKIANRSSIGVELKAAIFIASVVTILEHYHLLESLQQDNLQLAMPFLTALPVGISNADSSDSTIKAILIDDLTYENRFRQQSPLDRTELADIIQKILVQQPSVLVIDLDLSPAPLDKTSPTATVAAAETSISAPIKWSAAENALYSLLKQQRWQSTTEIVLTTPMPVFDPSLAKAKAEWMSEMCKAGGLGPARIRFALPDIPVVNGMPLSYDSSNHAMAYQVSQAALKTGSPNVVCASEDLTQYTRKHVARPAGVTIVKDLLNYRFASTIDTYDITEACGGDDCSKAQPGNSVVFFGGSYSPADTYSTPVGVLSGAILHAGGYYSITQPIQKTHVLLAYLLDILMGCTLGIIIYKLASLYRNERSLGSIAMNLAVQPLFPYLMVVMSGLMLAHFNLWLNPAPMIFGMAIHAGLVRIEEPYVEDVADLKLLGIPEIRIKQVIYCAVVLLAWVFLAQMMGLSGLH